MTIATDIQFFFQVCQTKMGIEHIQCLLKVDSSILAGVFLTSSFVLSLSLQGFSPMQQVAAYLYM